MRNDLLVWCRIDNDVDELNCNLIDLLIYNRTVCISGSPIAIEYPWTYNPFAYASWCKN